MSLEFGVAEDEEGFIWIGAYGGLCRYDGSKTLPVHHPEPPLQVRSLLRTGDTLWISTFDGIHLLDRSKAIRSNFPFRPCCRDTFQKTRKTP